MCAIAGPALEGRGSPCCEHSRISPFSCCLSYFGRLGTLGPRARTLSLWRSARIRSSSGNIHVHAMICRGSRLYKRSGLVDYIYRLCKFGHWLGHRGWIFHLISYSSGCCISSQTYSNGGRGLDSEGPATVASLYEDYYYRTAILAGVSIITGPKQCPTFISNCC